MKKYRDLPVKPQQLLRHPAHLLAFGLGAGVIRYAPGTWGTLIAVPFYFLMRELPLPVYVGLVALLFVFGVWICDITTRTLGVEDHPGIVFDEMVGYWVTMIAAPATFVSVVAGFVLFRIMDIWKPWPIRWIDRKVSGGLGIMLDDVLAGVYACVLLRLSMTFLDIG